MSSFILHTQPPPSNLSMSHKELELHPQTWHRTSDLDVAVESPGLAFFPRTKRMFLLRIFAFIFLDLNADIFCLKGPKPSPKAM